MRNLTHYWLTSHPPGAKQSKVKGGRGGAPAREISFVSLVAYGPKVSLLSLSHGALQLLKPGKVVPNTDLRVPMNGLPFSPNESREHGAEEKEGKLRFKRCHQAPARWSIVPCTRSLQIRFSVRSHIQVVGSIPGRGTTGGNSSMFLSHISLSLSLSPLPFSLSEIKGNISLGED